MGVHYLQHFLLASNKYAQRLTKLYLINATYAAAKRKSE